MSLYNTYRKKFHFPVNFYGIFLLVTFIPDILGISPDYIKYPFWAVKGILAIWIIHRYRKKIYVLSPNEQLFIFVILIYSINIFIDVFLENFTDGYGFKIDFISFLVSILIALSFRYDPLFSSHKSYIFLVTTLSVGLFLALFLALESDISGQEGRYGANSTVNTINYGQMGGALCLLAIYGFLNKQFKWSRVIFIALFCLGAISIMKAGSRSPLVVLLFVGAFYTIARIGLFKGLLIFICLGFITWLSLDFLVEVGKSVDSGLAERVVSAIEKKETSGRDKIYANTVDIIRGSPLFGDFYLINSGVGRNGYPHNFFLEAFMTTGLLGGIPFLIMTLIALVKSFTLLQTDHKASWIVLLFLQMVVYGMFSSALYSSQDFWALCLFVLTVVPHGRRVWSWQQSHFPESKTI